MKLNETYNNIIDIDQLNNCLGTLEAAGPHLDAYIGPWGGRRIVPGKGGCIYLDRGSLCINDLVKKLAAITTTATPPEKVQEAIQKIRQLDRSAEDYLIYYSNFLQKILTYIRRIFGNLGFNRNAIMQKLECDYPLPVIALPAAVPVIPSMNAPIEIPHLSPENIAFLDKDPFIKVWR